MISAPRAQRSKGTPRCSERMRANGVPLGACVCIPIWAAPAGRCRRRARLGKVCMPTQLPMLVQMPVHMPVHMQVFCSNTTSGPNTT